MKAPTSREIWLLLTTALATTIWGTTYLVTTQFLPPGRPLLAALLRALPIGLILLALFRRLPHGIWWWRAIVLGLLNIGFTFLFIFVAAYRLPGGIAGTVSAGLPLIVGLLNWWLLGERLTWRQVILGLISIAGVSLLVLTSLARLDALGLLAALGTPTAMGLGVVLTKRWGRPVPLLPFTAWQLVAGGLFLLPLTLFLEGVPSSLSWVNIAGYGYIGLIATGIAFALWFRGIGQLPVTATSFLPLFSPITATLVGWIFLGQSLTLLQLLGAMIVLVSVILSQFATTPKVSAPDAKTEASRPAASGKIPTHR